MLQTRRIPITELNEYLTCKLCKGYFIDATTIIECLHTFCRSCIVKYLESNKYCPVCDVQVHKTKPLLNIRPDKTLQDIVYKLVPRLFQNEMCKRREFYTSHPEVRPSNLEQCGEVSYQHILSPDETICISLNYHGHSGPPRYLRCPAAISVVHIQKLIRAKYDLFRNHRIDILHNQDCLNSHLTLMDVAYIYLWRRKDPLELTYRIYENTAKRLKLDSNSSISAADDGDDESSEAKNEWKEVQLRISESGEMCVTGVDNTTILNEEIAKGNMVEMKSEETSSKKEIPPLKPIIKTGANVKNKSTCPEEEAKPNATTASQITTTTTATTSAPCTSGSSNITVPSFLTTSTLAGAGVTRSTTTCTYTTLSSVTSCTTSRSNDGAASVVKDEKKKELPPSKPVDELSSNTAVPSEDKQSKRKNSGDAEDEPPAKQPKPTILNHSLALQGISLKQQSPKTAENGNKDVTFVSKTTTASNVIIRSVTTVVPPNSNIYNVSGTSTAITPTSKPIIINKSYAATRPATPSKKWSNKTAGLVSVPCYTPKTTYNSVLNVPRVSTSITKTDPKPSATTSSAKITSQPSVPTSSIETKGLDLKSATSVAPQTTVNNKISAKGSKTTAPLGAYRTLREPPKSWNSQISKAHVQKTCVDVKAGESKNTKPAKFFKMRNNMPRYLGNPASGVKPMYQVHSSPEKDKAGTTEVNSKPEKMEIRKHSIVKIDPKTLKPISEKAPETTSLSNQSDLKINTSSVPIFNPLKLQNSPKNERKSPKSPHSPPKTKTSSPTSKRDKLSLNFTPPNPFIPNLASPTLNPNQFLYSGVPPGFPAYDPRVVAAYHNLLYGQALPFPPNPVPRLNLELNQRKCFESPGSPKISSVCSITSSEGMLYSCPKISGISQQTSPRLTCDGSVLKSNTFTSTASQNHNMKHYNVSSVTMTSPRTSTSTDQTSTSNSKTSGHHNVSHNQTSTKTSSSSESQKEEKKSQSNSNSTQLSPKIPTSLCQNLSQLSSKNSSIKNSSKKSNGKDGVKPEKSLENAVEKLTQSKTKENAIAQKINDRIPVKNKDEKQPEGETNNNSEKKSTTTTTTTSSTTSSTTATDEKNIAENPEKKSKEEKSGMVNGRLAASNGSLESKNLRSNDKEMKNNEQKTDSNGNLPAKKVLDKRNCDEKSNEDAATDKTTEDKEKTTENSDLGNDSGNLLVQTDAKH